MMEKDSLFLLISNVFGRGPTNDQMMVKDSLFLLISNVFGRGPTNDG